MTTGLHLESPSEKQAVSIAVLPFQCLTPESEPEGFTRGLLDDLAAELARYPTLEVVAPDSTVLAARMTAGTMPFQPQFLVQGSVRCVPSRIRINVQLLDATQSRSVWAERYDAPLAELFLVEDEIVGSIANALQARIDTDRLGKARKRPIASLEAYDCWLRGYELLRRGTLEDDLEARTFFQRAVELDPAWARGYAGLSLSYFNEWSCQAWHIFQENADGAYEHAMRAVALDDADALIHIVLARVYLHRREFPLAENHFEKALALNPNGALTLAHLAIGKTLLGCHEEALRHSLKAMRLHPLHEDFYYATAGMPLFHLERFEEADSQISKAGVGFADLSAYRAAVAASLGNLTKAHRERLAFLKTFQTKITFGREPDPGEPHEWLLQVNPYLRAEDRERFSAWLQAAGIPAKPGISSTPREAITRPADLPLNGNIFRWEARNWKIAFGGAGAILADLKGMHDIAHLLSRPETPVHCLELLGAPMEPNQPGAILDQRARAAYQARIRELQSDLDDAESRQDLARAEFARAELDTLAEELTKALGLGGKPRKLADPAERARSAVTWRIRSAIKNIQAAHPRLGAHLTNSLRTGTYCVYSPEQEFTWQT